MEMYRLMLIGRKFTMRSLEMFREGRLPAGLHPSAGQEEVGVGACFGLRPGDWVVPSLRTTEAFSRLKAPIEKVANAGVPVPHSDHLHPHIIPGKADVIAAIRRVLDFT